MSDNTLRPDENRVDAQAARMPSVLIADDDEDIRQALRVVLEEEGYTVLEALDGAETLNLLYSSTPLVVLLDVIMPHVSGYEVLMRVIKDDALRVRHAYIVLTAEHMSSGRIGPRFSQLVGQHQIPVIAKPFDLVDLLDAVALQIRRLSPAPVNAHNATDTTSA